MENMEIVIPTGSFFYWLSLNLMTMAIEETLRLYNRQRNIMSSNTCNLKLKT